MRKQTTECFVITGVRKQTKRTLHIMPETEIPLEIVTGTLDQVQRYVHDKNCRRSVFTFYYTKIPYKKIKILSHTKELQ